MRCTHEAQLHKHSIFITLTYSDANLPAYGTLVKKHLQKFFKRVRKTFHPFRYYACGEYGDHTKRPHYHACIFGLDFTDKKEFRRSGDHVLYTSERLNELWGYGHTSLSNFTFETAAYTARYVMKKQFGVRTMKHAYLDEDTGELTAVVEPYAVMSLRPAIAKQWLHQYYTDIYGNDKDSLRINGVEVRAPKYYDKLYELIDPRHLQYLKIEREKAHEKLTPQQLHAREINTHARINAKTQI